MINGQRLGWHLSGSCSGNGPLPVDPIDLIEKLLKTAAQADSVGAKDSSCFVKTKVQRRHQEERASHVIGRDAKGAC
jgi:hypothetical protein